MYEGDLDSSIPDYMLFGSGFLTESSTAKNSDDNIECVPQQHEISGHEALYPKTVSSKCRNFQSERSVSDPGKYFNSNCITTHDKSKMQIYPVEKVGSEVDIISCENYEPSSLSQLRNNETKDEKNRKCDAASESAKRQEGQLMIEGGHSDETYTFSFRPEKYEHFGKTVECSKTKEYNETKNLALNLSQKGVLTLKFELGPTRETIQGLERSSFNINSNLYPAPEIENELEPKTSDPFYTCLEELQNGDQLTTNNDFAGLSSTTDEVETKITSGDMKKPDGASNIPQEGKENSSFGQDNSPLFNSLHVSYDNEERVNNDSNTHWSSLNDGEISVPDNHVSTKVTDAAQSIDGSSLNADSLYGDDIEQDLDSESCDKAWTHVITKDNTVTMDAAMTLVKGGTVEKLRNLDLTSKIQGDKEMINISYSLNKTDERLECSLLESLFNTNNGLHSNKSTASDVSVENTHVKELSDNYEISVVNEDYFNRHEKNNKSLVNDFGIESSQTRQYAEGPDHKCNANILESLIVVPEQSAQFQDINYTYPQDVNVYTSEKYNFPSAPQNEIDFPQGASRLLVGDTERSMEDSFVSDAEVHRNGRSEESIKYELANEFRKGRVDALNHRETDFSVNHNEQYDHDLFGGSDGSHFHHTQGMSSTAHQLSLENSSVLPQIEKTQEIIPSEEATLPVHTANSLLSHHKINETSNVELFDWANDISGEISVPVQEAFGQSLRFESLHRDSERPIVFRQTSCPTPQSETNSFDEEQQRDFEYALELQRQLNHEICIEDEAFARHLDNSQRQTLSPPEYSSRRTEFFQPRVEEMINRNPQRMQQRQQHSNRLRRRHRSETSVNSDEQRNREPSLEDMISLHENNSLDTVQSHETSQGNLQDVMQHRGGVAGANVADSRIPIDSGFQNVRQHSRRASNRDRPVSHRVEPGPVERVERIPGQSAQINPNVIIPLTWNYQEDRRQREEQRRQLEARYWEHQYHQQQHSRTGLDLLPTEDYPSLDVHHSYYDPDETFGTEDGEQYVSITQDLFTLRRFLMTRRPSFEIPDQDSYNELWNLVERLGEVRHQGLDQTHIEMLPVHIFNEGNSGETKECNICLSAYTDGDEIRTLTCLHMFHTACIDEWLSRNAACPVCRRRIEIDDSSQ